jgi:hypothetical protein
MPVDWIRRLGIAFLAMIVLAGLGIWFTQFLPKYSSSFISSRKF